MLIAAPSNTAVDNILEKLISVTPDQEGQKFLINGCAAFRVVTLLVCFFIFSGHRRKSKKKTSATTASKTGAIKVVRLGHPARISKTAQKYSLEALVKKDDDMTVVDDIKVRVYVWFAVQLGVDWHARDGKEYYFNLPASISNRIRLQRLLIMKNRLKGSETR